MLHGLIHEIELHLVVVVIVASSVIVTVIIVHVEVWMRTLSHYLLC